MNMEKIRVFGNLQDQVMQELQGDTFTLVTYHHEAHGMAIHNPFMDVSGRFDLEDPIGEYGEGCFAYFDEKIAKIEAEMGVSVEEMEANDLLLYLGGKFYQGKEPSLACFEKIGFEEEPMFVQNEETNISESLNFYVPLFKGFEELIPEGALAYVVPKDDSVEVNLYLDYDIASKEISLSYIVKYDGSPDKNGVVKIPEEAKEGLLAKMDAYVKEWGEESLEAMVSEAVNEDIWEALEKAVKESWYAQPDENGNYEIEISADYRETNEGLLEGAYENRESVELRNGIMDEIWESYEEAISNYEDGLLEKAGLGVDSSYYDQAKDILRERVTFEPDYDYFMKGDMRMNLLLATAHEQNVEFTDIKDNLARWIDVEAYAEMKKDAEKYGSVLREPDNALLWLVKQQGYSMDDLKRVYGEYKAFIEDNYYPNGSPKGLKATNIDWDVDCEEDRDFLPTEIEIPEGMTDKEEISDYISDETGFCHNGFRLEGTDISYDEKIKILNEKNSEFLVSVCEAIYNQTRSMGCLTVLMKSSLGEYCDLFERDENSGNLLPKEIVIPKDAYLTLHNPWDGAGHEVWIALEKDLVVPNSMIFDSEIEGVKSDRGWTVDSISGLVGTCWKESKGVREVGFEEKEVPSKGPSLDEMIHGAAGRIGDSGDKAVLRQHDMSMEK